MEGILNAKRALTVCVVNQSSRQARVALKALRRRLAEELMRFRIVRIRHYLTVSCIPQPEHSPWMCIWHFGNDQNMTTVTSLCSQSFNRLLERFTQFYVIPSYYPRGGRPTKLQQHHQVLGVLMSFYVGSMGQKTLRQNFGVPHSTLSRSLNAAEAALSSALHGFSPARIVWPTLTRQNALARLTAAREPLLPFTWGFIDVKNYRVQEPPLVDEQNAHYNGWLHDVFVTGTLFFSADGLIVWCKHNCPGSWNDSDTSLSFREALADPLLNPDPRYGVIADSAFPCSEEMVGMIMTPLKEGDLNRLYPSIRPAAHALSKALTFQRQAVEWGMGSFDKVFHRLIIPLPCDKEKRKVRLDNMFRLANYRVRTLQVSQIRTTWIHHKADNS